MKLIFLLSAVSILFSTCKHDDFVAAKPNTTTNDKIVFFKELTLKPYDTHATNCIVASNSQFLVLNTDWNTGNKSYPGYFITHTWFDEFFNESCKNEGFYYTGSFQANACEGNGSLFYYFHSYYQADLLATKFLNKDVLGSLHGCNLSGTFLFDRQDTVTAGTAPTFIDFIKVTQKGTIVFLLKDSVYCMDTLGGIKWKIPLAPLNLITLRDVCETSTGDILFLGEKQSALGDRDFCLTRFDKNGNITWQKLYGGKYYEEAQQILYNSDQAIFMIGSSNSYNNNGSNDAFIIQINSDGDTIKQKTFGGLYNDALRCGKFYQDKIVVCGYHDPDGSAKEQVFVTLLNKNLDVLQQADAPYTTNRLPTSCALINNTFAICGDRFLMRFTLPD